MTIDVERLAAAFRVLPPVPERFLLTREWIDSEWLPNAHDYAHAIAAEYGEAALHCPHVAPCDDCALAWAHGAIAAEYGTPASPETPLREAVVEYLAADADMPEFADAQRMPAEEWDRRNRRWSAADVALRAALANEEAQHG